MRATMRATMRPTVCRDELTTSGIRRAVLEGSIGALRPVDADTVDIVQSGADN